MQDGVLKDGSPPSARASRVYFLGLPWNVDFAKQWDFSHALSGWMTTFYIGETF